MDARLAGGKGVAVTDPGKWLMGNGHMRIGVPIVLLIALLAAGCVDASSVLRPEVGLGKPGEGSSMTASVKREGGRAWIGNLIRFPWLVERVDENGHVVEIEREKCDNVLGCLYTAIKMLGHDVSYPELWASSGEAFRFAFEENWNHDPEYITPIDALATACDILGFEYTSLKDRDLAETLAAIEQSIDRGVPVLTGMDERWWCLIVGYDRDTGEYYYLGGRPGNLRPRRAKLGEAVSSTISVDECPAMPIPETDWYSCYYGPEQVVRNAAFILGPRQPVPVDDTIRKTLRLAGDLARPRRIERANLDLRQEGSTPRMKYFWCAWPGHFDTGTDGIRKWAAAVDGLDGPTHNFGIIHANDTTLGMQMRRLSWAASYLRWAAGEVHGKARRHLEAAARLFEEAVAVDLGMLCRYTCDAHTQEAIQEAIAEYPGLVYIVDGDKEHLLGELSARSRRCAWGFSVVPDQETFDVARQQAVANLNRIADLRDKAISETEKALAALE